MKRAGVFIVLVSGLLLGSSSFADNHKNKNFEPRPNVDPKLGAALLAYEHRDFKKALILLTLVATRGEAEAQFILGRLHALGLGTKTDTNEAEKWYRKSAKQGHPRAQFRLARILDRKKRKHYGEVFALLHKAAKAGHARAQFWLATKYISGDEVTQSVHMWLYWVRKAAYQGDKYARSALGLSYYFGRRVVKDPVLALMWTILAEKSGHPGAKSWGEYVSEKMTREQIDEAKRLAGLW